MALNRMCENCKVNISEDLSNCPLCGKHIGHETGEVITNKKSYPLYDFKTIEKTRWYNIIRVLFWFVGITSIVVNLIFKTEPYWFPYVLSALIMIFHVFIDPVKTKSFSNYIKSLNLMSILVAIFLIFIDAYNHYSFKTTFGWSISLVSPCVVTAGVMASSIICFCSKRHEVELLKGVSFVAVFSVLYFIMKMVFFKDLIVWPSLMLMCASIGFVLLLEVFKRNKLIKELSKEFHV